MFSIFDFMRLREGGCLVEDIFSSYRTCTISTSSFFLSLSLKTEQNNIGLISDLKLWTYYLSRYLANHLDSAY